MRAFLLSILVLAFVAGCQSPPQPQDPPEGYDFGAYPSEIESKVRAYFEVVLKDPESARYRYEDGFIKVVCNKWLGDRAITYAGWGKVVGVNAKNSYGGYTGETRYAFLFEGEPCRVCRRPFSLREWPNDRQEAETSLLARGA